MKNITINGQVLSYKDEAELFSKGLIMPAPIKYEEAKLLVQTTKDLFSKIGIEFYLAFGTLLGAIRDNGIIPGDEDVDVFIKDEEKLRENLIWLQEQGLGVIRIEEGALYSFRLNGSQYYIDVYIHRPLKNTIWSFYCDSLNNWVMPKKYFKDIEHINFVGIDVLMPRDPEKLLAFWYGKTWRVPERGHFFYYEVRTAFYWHHPMQMPKDILRFILGRKHLRK